MLRLPSEVAACVGASEVGTTTYSASGGISQCCRVCLSTKKTYRCSDGAANSADNSPRAKRPYPLAFDQHVASTPIRIICAQDSFKTLLPGPVAYPTNSPIAQNNVNKAISGSARANSVACRPRLFTRLFSR